MDITKHIEDEGGCVALKDLTKAQRKAAKAAVVEGTLRTFLDERRRYFTTVEGPHPGDDTPELAASLGESPVTEQDLEAQLAQLRAENEALKAGKLKAVQFKVSPKGGVSVYGLGRFPTTLYVEQWERLFAGIDQLKAFIEANRTSLKTK